MVWTIGPAGAIIAKNAKALNVQISWWCSATVQPDPTYIKLAGAAANGTVMPSTRLMVASQLPELYFRKGRAGVYPRIPAERLRRSQHSLRVCVGCHSHHSDAIAEAGTDPEKIRDAIEHTRNYIGVSGIYNITPENHCGLDSSSLVMITVKNGKWVLIK